jgi:Putative integrase
MANDNEIEKTDVELQWLPRQFGNSWEDWRYVGAKWLQSEPSDIDVKLTALNIFFVGYLFDHRLSPLLDHFFTQEPILRPNLVVSMDNCYSDQEIVLYHNTILDFIDWVITTQYSVEDDQGNLCAYAINPFNAIHSG